MKWYYKIVLFSVVYFMNLTSIQGQVLNTSWKELIHAKDDSWFATEEAKAIAENVLLYQRNIGGWPKNIQMQQPLTPEQKQALVNEKSNPDGCTTDNGATCQELLFLSNMYKQVPDIRYSDAFILGINYLLAAQYDNGGWPQFYPYPAQGYYRHITFNDDSMVNILKILKEIKDETDYFSVKPPGDLVKKAKIAFDKGIDCILKTQYRQNGVLTAWCAQHDAETLLPAKARAYELPSLSGKESAQIVLLLMSIKEPSPEVVNAVNSAVLWFEKVKIKGLREVRIYNDHNKVIDKKIVADPEAPAIWARFMELETNKPFFCDRDGVKKDSLSQIGLERKIGYAWYTDEPHEVLRKYPKWQEKVATTNQGIKKNKHTPNDEYNIVVAKDGSGDYTSIQEAINSARSFPDQRIRIYIKNGVYYEKVKVHEWNTHISLLGESKEQTIITYDDYFGKMNMGRNSTFYTYTVLVEGAHFHASNLTIQNTSGDVGQAVALSVFADKAVITNCTILGNQDTLYVSGDGSRQYFKDCYIEGTTDFIFGKATAVFENCTLHSKKNSYITAASTPEGNSFGFVFKNCKLTADNNCDAVYLGRPWRIHAKTVFINCEMGKHIKPEGWHNWSKPEAEKTAFYAEYKCTGEGYQPDKRVSWSHQLKKSAAKKYVLKNIFAPQTDTEATPWYLQFN